MKKIQLFLVMLLVSCLTVAAQTTAVTGKVTYADDGAPVIGATIVVKGTHVATLTDVNGAYKITIPAGADKVLLVTAFGLHPKEISVTQSGTYDVVMETDATQLDEVVVTAYGTTTKKAFTGSAAVVNAKDIANLQVTSATKALQGLASGVMVVNANGQPGQDATIRVRGIGTFTSTTTDANAGSPLIVVDGVPYSGNLNQISPNDIESMTVLKDANSTALYGSRAANGVLMITTKQGRSGKARVTANVSLGFSSRAVKDYEYLGAESYLEQYWMGRYTESMYGLDKDGKFTNQFTDEQARKYASGNVMPSLIYNPYGSNPAYNEPVGLDGKVIPGARLLYDSDWYDALTRIGQRAEYNLQVSGGNEATQYLISAGTVSDEGIIEMSKYMRYNGRVKVDSKVNNWLKVGMNSAITYSDQNYPLQADNYASNAMGFIRAMSNIYPVYTLDKDGKPVLDANGNMMPDLGVSSHPGNQIGQRPLFKSSNPLATTILDDRTTNRLSVTANGYVEAHFLKNFTFRSSLGVEYYQLNASIYMNNMLGDAAPYKGLSSKSRDTRSTITFVNTLTYDQTFDEKHHVNVLVGMDSYDFKQSYLFAERRGFTFPGVTEIDYASGAMSVESNSTGTRNVRFIGRANYDYDNKYHISASYSYDGTSRFSGPKKWGGFYSVGAAWNILNEPFMESASDWLSNLKLRASYGTSGNANIGYFPYLPTYTAGWDILDNAGSVIGRLGNPDLGWESQEQLDIGVDFGFLNGVLNLGVTYFDRVSSDLLMARPLPPSIGVGSINANIGKIQNSGVEIEFRANIINKGDVRWSAGFNASYIQNKVLALPNNNADMSNPSSSYKRLSVGSSSFNWYMPEFAGINPENGLPMWYRDVRDAEGKVTGRETTSTIGNATNYMLDDALPKWTGGINTSFSYKGIELSVLGTFSLGGKILDMDKAGLMHNFSRAGYQVSKDVERAWKKPGDITDVARLQSTTTSFNSMSSRWLVDGSYFRIRNITVGYDLCNITAIKKLGFNNLRVYCAMDNMFTLFGTEGLDPEQGLSSVTSNTTSALKTVSFGINIGF